MVIISTLRTIVRSASMRNSVSLVPARGMSGHGPRTFPLQPTRWQWNRFKDLLHYYAMMGLIPVTAVVMYANIFIGPATLSEIPEGYVPKPHEYFRHPITRWLAKHVFMNPQQEYEKFMHHIYEENEKRLLRQLETEVKEKLAERRDFAAYYYKPVLAKYHRKSREASDYLRSIQGD